MPRFTAAPILLMGVALAGCDTIGDPFEEFSARRNAPDEFQVIARDELRMPGNVIAASPGALPTPSPGAPSPLEPDPQAEAIAALTGGRSAATLPRGTAASRGESALLDAADAAQASSEIRSQIARENIELSENAPYEPPLLLDLLTGSSPEFDPETVLDPVQESQRLQTQGVATPNDPDAVAVVEEVAEPEDPDPYYATRSLRRGVDNRIPTNTSTPAFPAEPRTARTAPVAEEPAEPRIRFDPSVDAAAEAQRALTAPQIRSQSTSDPAPQPDPQAAAPRTATRQRPAPSAPTAPANRAPAPEPSQPPASAPTPAEPRPAEPTVLSF
ncbi:MAG: DUF3035 domain-containing protein [Paracoccaceae bacterium]